VVSMLASGTRVRGLKPGRSRWIFRASEKSSAFLLSLAEVSRAYVVRGASEDE